MCVVDYFIKLMLMIRFRAAWLLFLFVCTGTALSAQRLTELKKNGEKYFAHARWKEAQQQLAQYQEQKPGDFTVLTKLGIASYWLHQGDQARKYLEYVASRNPESTDPDLFYYLARTLHGQSEYERAIPFYKSFLRVCGEKHPLRAGIADEIRRCVSGMASHPNDAVALVENMGDRVNSPGDEFAPLPSVNHPDRLYYAAARPESTGGRRNDDGLEDSIAGHWCSDMLVATLKTGGWEHDGDLGSLMNTPRYEVALGFNPTGQVLYYFRGFTLYSGDIMVDTAGRKDEYATLQPVFKGPMQPEEGDCDPLFVNDTTLIFASRRAGGLGGLDLYLTQFTGGQWTNPQNLGPVVNSAYDERSPFLARDGRTLYFSSNNTGSMGGLDVFRSVYDDAKLAWQTPVNMGAGINSPGDDAYYRLSADGRTGYFSSDRLDALGQRDIYLVYFKEEVAEQTHTSVPALFTEAGKKAAGKEAVPERRTAIIPVLMYDNDRDLLADDNLKTVEKVALLGKSNPDATVLITVHTDETGPAKFDLYNGIKRAEALGKALTDRGVSATGILLRSCGSAYPVARTVLDATPNPIGQHLNRRVEMTLVWKEGQAPFDIRVERPVISELMAAPGGQTFNEQVQGLYYKIEVAATRQLYNSDALSMFPDLMIESQPGTGTYRYSAGLYKSYQKAAQVRLDFQKVEFNDAVVVAYIDGIRVSRAEAVGMLKKYPDLANYIKG